MKTVNYTYLIDSIKGENVSLAGAVQSMDELAENVRRAGYQLDYKGLDAALKQGRTTKYGKEESAWKETQYVEEKPENTAQFQELRAVKEAYAKQKKILDEIHPEYVKAERELLRQHGMSLSQFVDRPKEKDAFLMDHGSDAFKILKSQHEMYLKETRKLFARWGELDDALTKKAYVVKDDDIRRVDSSETYNSMTDSAYDPSKTREGEREGKTKPVSELDTMRIYKRDIRTETYPVDFRESLDLFKQIQAKELLERPLHAIKQELQDNEKKYTAKKALYDEKSAELMAGNESLAAGIRGLATLKAKMQLLETKHQQEYPEYKELSKLFALRQEKFESKKEAFLEAHGTPEIQEMKADYKAAENDLKLTRSRLHAEEERLKGDAEAYIRGQGQKALDAIVGAYMEIPLKMAENFNNPGLTPDLIQEGNVALLNAAKRFQPDKYRHLQPDTFEKYASRSVHGAMTRFIRANTQSFKLTKELTEQMDEMVKVQNTLFQTLGRSPRASEIAAEMNTSLNQKAAKAILSESDRKDPAKVEGMAEAIKAYKALKDPLISKDAYVEAEFIMKKKAQAAAMEPKQYVRDLEFKMRQVSSRENFFQEKYKDLTEEDVKSIQIMMQPSDSLDRPLDDEEKMTRARYLADPKAKTPEEETMDRENEQEKLKIEQATTKILFGFPPRIQGVFRSSFGINSQPKSVRDVAAEAFHKPIDEVTDEEVNAVAYVKSKAMYDMADKVLAMQKNRTVFLSEEQVAALSLQKKNMKQAMKEHPIQNTYKKQFGLER